MADNSNEYNVYVNNVIAGCVADHSNGYNVYINNVIEGCVALFVLVILLIFLISLLRYKQEFTNAGVVTTCQVPWRPFIIFLVIVLILYILAAIGFIANSTVQMIKYSNQQ
jgi:hypothetical protein